MSYCNVDKLVIHWGNVTSNVVTLQHNYQCCIEWAQICLIAHMCSSSWWQVSCQALIYPWQPYLGMKLKHKTGKPKKIWGKVEKIWRNIFQGKSAYSSTATFQTVHNTDDKCWCISAIEHRLEYGFRGGCTFSWEDTSLRRYENPVKLNTLNTTTVSSWKCSCSALHLHQ